MGHNNRAAMRSPLNILIFVHLIAGQCEDTFHDGTACGAGDSILKPDMESCWKYYECDDGCVKHVTCEEDYKYDIPYEWCSPPRDVDCGERPCNDAVHCPEDLTTTICGQRPICDECNENCEDPPPPIDCGHDLDC